MFYEDIFEIREIDPMGKKFDRGILICFIYIYFYYISIKSYMSM